MNFEKTPLSFLRKQKKCSSQKHFQKLKKEKKEPRRGYFVLFFFSSVHFFSRKITNQNFEKSQKETKKSLDLFPPLVVLYKAARMFHIVFKIRKLKRKKN